MKKIQLLSAAVLCLLMGASCTREAAIPDAVHTVIRATLEDNTKTALGDYDAVSQTWPNYWKTDDVISVNGSNSNPVDPADDGKSSVLFEFNDVPSTPLCATYPASAVSGYDSGSATITIPARQEYVVNSYDPAAYVMMGKSDNANAVALSPVVSLIHLNLTGSASISSIKITGDDADDKLSGSFTTDFAALTPKAVSPVVELVADTPVSLPADFFISVPAGLSGLISVNIYDSEGGYMSKQANVKSALAAGQMYSAPSLAYSGSYNINISAEGITSSTAVICWDNSPAAAYTIGVYSDAGCTSLVKSYAVPADDSCWSNAAPRFCISGLAANTTYYVKVTNVAHSTDSNILPVTTEDFTIVEVSSAPAAEGDVILAEDFSELEWDCDMIGNGAGWFPTTAAQQTSFSTLDVDSYQAATTSNEKQLSAQTNALAGSRLMHWAQGAKPHMYVHPGYIKLVGSNNVTHLVTPALDNIPDGKVATIEVEVTASRYYSESSGAYATDKAIVAVQPAGTYNELLLGPTNGLNTLDLENNIANITLKAETAWKTYKVTLNGVSKGDRLAFGAAKSIQKNEARMNISDMKVTIKALYDPNGLTASVKNVSSSTAAFTWTHTGSASQDIAVPYTIALYRNSACTDLVVSHEIDANDDSFKCWDGKMPCFVFGGLDPDTEYWFVATDSDTGAESNPVSATTEDFSPVHPIDVDDAAVGDVLLAEDFSEVAHGPDEFAVAVGFVPDTHVLTDIPSGANPSGGFVIYSNTGNRLYGSGWDITGTRLENGWGFFGNSTVYSRNGYLRITTTDAASRTHLITPKLSGIPAGKLATIEVTVTATKHETNANDVAVFVEKGLTMNGATDPSSGSFHKYTGASLSGGHALGITSVKEWQTESVIISKVDANSQLAIGSLENISGKNRFSISDVVVTLVALKNPGDIDSVMEINDFTTLKAFLTACQQPGITIQGNVTADIALTSSQVEEIDALYPVAECDGIVNGNNHTISGLTKPLFNILSGSVSDLTLNSSLNITSAMNNIGILACSADNATISGCVSNGSVALNYASEINGDLSVAGMVGLIDGGSMTDCVNNASVTNNSSSNGEMHIGGIAGISYAELDSCSNTGDITNNGSTDTKEINVAGITAFCYADLTSCSNSGTISNTATSGTSSIQDLQVGGIVSNVKDPGYTLTSCVNTGAVSNSGEASTVSIGGIAAWSTKGTFVTCHNSGPLTNSGVGTNSEAACGVRIGGIVGAASQANTLSGDASHYNYNEGTILENSESERITIGGICGWANNDGTTMDYAQNMAAGEITISGGTRYYVYVGGVLGCNSAKPSFSYTKNAGNINFSDLTISKALYAGGVHGGFLANGSHTITGCENTGAIYCPNSGDKGNNMKSTSGASVVTYIGGVSSGAGDGSARTSKVFNDCINKGSITVYNQLWTRLGGVLGYANQNPSGCENHGKIVYYRYKGGYESGNGAVGGVIGYINIASVSNLTNTGGVQSTGSSPNCYTGGIVGQEGGNMNTMTNCNVGKPGGSAINIVGAGSGSFGSSGAGLFVASASKKAWTFTDCQVITGTKCQSVVVTDENMADAVVGRNHASSITNPPTLVSSF